MKNTKSELDANTVSLDFQAIQSCTLTAACLARDEIHDAIQALFGKLSTKPMGYDTVQKAQRVADMASLLIEATETLYIMTNHVGRDTIKVINVEGDAPLSI